MYRYVGCECLFRDECGKLHALEIESPLAYETEEDAERDNTSCCFVRKGGDVVLQVYSTKWAIVENDDRGKKVIRSAPAGKLLAEYTTEEFFENPANRIRKYVGLNEYQHSDFVQTDSSFEDLFPDLESGRKVYVSQGESYYVRKEME